MPPLAGLTVLELSAGVSGPYAGKLFADFGADVVKVEPPGGDPARLLGPFPGDEPDPEQSAMFLHLNTNKRSVVLDLDEQSGVDRLRDLVRRSDIVIESVAGADLQRLSMRFEDVREMNPRAVVTSVTPFGRTGPFSNYVGADIVYYAMGGPMHATGVAEREPVKLGSHVVSVQAGNMAATATMAALMVAEQSGIGVHVDVSNYECQAGSIDRRLAAAVGYAYSGTVGERNPGTRSGAVPNGIYPTADGYVQIITIPAWVPRMLATLQSDELAEAFAQPGAFLNPELQELTESVLYPWLLERTKQQAMQDAQEHRWPITAVNLPADVVEDPHFAERGFFVEAAHPVAGRVRQPGAPVRMQDGWSLRRPAPTLGQHTNEVLSDLRVGTVTAREAATASATRLPLAGIRVLDMTVVWAGPYTTMLLADLGAEVIRLDNPWVFPSSTKGFAPAVPPGVPQGPLTAPYPDHEPNPRPYNRHAMFNCHARNKRIATLDLRKESGVEVFIRLVEQADVLVENNAAKTMDQLGLTWERLSAANPRLVMMRMPPLGLDGPYRDFVGFGAHFEAVSGLTGIRGYADADPTTTTATFHMDPASGTIGAFAVMAALRRREHSGRGEFVELPQAENMLQHIGDLLVDAARTGRRHEPMGNRHPMRAPQGCYQCEGADRWVVISVGTDEEWAGLRRAMDDPSWAADPRFGTPSGRREHHDEIDAAIGAWTSGLDRFEVFARCQSERVPAGPVMDEADLYADAHLASRGFFRQLTSPVTGTHTYPGHLWRWTGPELRWEWGAHGLGDDNDYVYRELLGMDDKEYARMCEEGHISADYLAPDGTPL